MDKIRPVYYGGEENPLEPVKIIEKYGLNYNLGTALVYILREGRKSTSKPGEDLRKSLFFIEREIQSRENK